MRLPKTLAVLWAILLSCTPGLAFADFSGTVISVLDGDSIKVMHDGKAEKIRLNGIDCPEKRQAYGHRAKERTAQLTFEQTVTVTTYGPDKYGRTIGDVALPDGRLLNQELVRVGLCWWYRKYAPDDTVLAGLEKEARQAMRGLWAELDPIPPWVFRKAQR